MAMKAAEQSRLPNLSGLTVLVVDDDLDAIELLSTFLAACSAQVLFARSAPEGLAYIDTVPKLDAVITDLSMPGMDGVDFTKTIRTRRSVPVIALTGHQETYVTTEEFDAFLQKPVDLDKLCAVIQILLAERRPSRSSPSGHPKR